MNYAACLLAASTLTLALTGCSRNEEAEGQGMATAPTAAATIAAAEPAAMASDAPAGAETPAPAVSASPSPTPTTAATATPAAKIAVAATAPAAFAICSACHSVKRGDNGLGPSLAGVYGDKAGDVPGFDFSPAMKGSGLTWNEATLDKYLTDPLAVVPGTKMGFAGLKDAGQRKAVIEYLKGI